MTTTFETAPWGVMIHLPYATEFAGYVTREQALDAAFVAQGYVEASENATLVCTVWENHRVVYTQVDTLPGYAPITIEAYSNVTLEEWADAAENACEVCGGNGHSEICAITAYLGYTPR